MGWHYGVGQGRWQWQRVVVTVDRSEREWQVMAASWGDSGWKSQMEGSESGRTWQQVVGEEIGVGRPGWVEVDGSWQQLVGLGRSWQDVTLRALPFVARPLSTFSTQFCDRFVTMSSWRHDFGKGRTFSILRQKHFRSQRLLLAAVGTLYLIS